jgi:ParB family chromosome partitioning protein
MNEKKSKLGAGLNSLFKGDLESVLENRLDTFKIIPIQSIKIAPWQPRKEFDSAQLEELANSIKQHGVLQPILVKKDEQGFMIVAGERRYRASVLANLESIPAIIIDHDAQTLLEVAMIENLQRKDLNPVEKAEGFAFLIEKFNLTHAQLAERLGINRSVVSNYLRVNNLSNEIM